MAADGRRSPNSLRILLQSVLSNISTEITTLQQKSVSMSVQLTNRQSIRGQLSTFIEDMTVPEELITYGQLH